MAIDGLSPISGRPQVLIAGAGPGGLVAAITLARYGVGVLVVDRREETSLLSRALVISTRGMELMRRFGLEEEVRRGAADVELRAWVTPSLASGMGVEMPLGMPTEAEAAVLSPTRPAWAPQDHHEPVLLAHLREASSAQVRFGCELVGLQVRAEGMAVVLLDRNSGATSTVEADYVVGADGAHSTVRDQLGIPMARPADPDDRASDDLAASDLAASDLASYERVEFRAPLADVVGNRRYGLYVITDPITDNGGGCVLAPRGNGGRWGLSRERAIGEPGLEDLSEHEVVALICRAAGVEGLQPQIERCSSFTFAAQIAERYRRGRGFLLGDAAHRMTPRGGTGMNTAIQDAFDLGWKLGWVLAGWAPPALLDSYEAERRPIGLHNVERSAEPGGARRAVEEELPWDLNGRVAHHWVDPARTVSTIDLIGDGLTLFAGPDEPRWAKWAAGPTTTVDGTASPPLSVHVLDVATLRTLGLGPGGAVLLRPDGRELRRWSTFDEATLPLVMG